MALHSNHWLATSETAKGCRCSTSCTKAVVAVPISKKNSVKAKKNKEGHHRNSAKLEISTSIISKHLIEVACVRERNKAESRLGLW